MVGKRFSAGLHFAVKFLPWRQIFALLSDFCDLHKLLLAHLHHVLGKLKFELRFSFHELEVSLRSLLNPAAAWEVPNVSLELLLRFGGVHHREDQITSVALDQ